MAVGVPLPGPVRASAWAALLAWSALCAPLRGIAAVGWGGALAPHFWGALLWLRVSPPARTGCKLWELGSRLR